jgi:hypothetical protein
MIRVSIDICIIVIALLAVTCGAAQVSTPATIASTFASRILPPAPVYVFPAKKYTYSVQWRLFNAGTAAVQIHRSGNGEHITATANSSGFPDKIFRVHNIFNADIDPRSYCTLRVSKHSEEGPRRHELNELLNYSRLKSEVDLTDLKTSAKKHMEFDIPPCVTDVVSGFFYVASLPLTPGYSQIFPVNDNGKTTDVMIKVEGYEHVKGPMGEFETVRVGVEPLSGPLKGKGVLWVWFTTDHPRLAVQIKSKLGFATLFFQLQRTEPASK